MAFSFYDVPATPEKGNIVNLTDYFSLVLLIFIVNAAVCKKNVNFSFSPYRACHRAYDKYSEIYRNYGRTDRSAVENRNHNTKEGA